MSLYVCDSYPEFLKNSSIAIRGGRQPKRKMSKDLNRQLQKDIQINNAGFPHISHHGM